MALTTVKGSVIDRGIYVTDYGATGDGTTDDSTAFQAAITAAVADQKTLYIPEGAYYFASRLTFSGSVDVRSAATASMRWDGTAANVGILLDYEASSDTLARMEFPLLYGPAINSSFTIPNLGTQTYDLTTRVGTAIHLKGGNRLDIRCQVANGFQKAFFVESTASSTCDNLNLVCNTSDFCETFLYLDSTGGNGISQCVAKVNTVWAKFPVYTDTTSGYINGAYVRIEGTAFVNEIGGCGIYHAGTSCVSSSFFINQIQAGTRDDSITTTPVLLSPPGGTWSNTPVEAELVTQATSGATGVVVTNADYTLSTSTPITVQAVTGTFDATNSCSGDTSGALGVPASVRGLVCPWLAGDQTMNTLSYDAEQTGTLAYNGSAHCNYEIGAPMSPPGGGTHGAFLVYPEPGDTTRIRDNGTHNRVKIINAYAGGAASPTTAVTLAASAGEANFDGGIGTAKFMDWVYCYISADSLASGATLTRYLYHCKVSDQNTLQPIITAFKNTGANSRNADISLTAYSNGETNNRQITVLLKNLSGTALETTQDVYFWVGIL